MKHISRPYKRNLKNANKIYQIANKIYENLSQYLRYNFESRFDYNPFVKYRMTQNFFSIQKCLRKDMEMCKMSGVKSDMRCVCKMRGTDKDLEIWA